MQLYRYEGLSYEGHGRFGVELEPTIFKIVKETPKGYWLKKDWGGKKIWRSKAKIDRFASSRKRDALLLFQYRKRSQIKILEDQIEGAKKALEIANTKSDVHISPYERCDFGNGRNGIDWLKARTEEAEIPEEPEEPEVPDEFLTENDMVL